MSTSTAHESPQLAALEERARAAWAAYRDNLVDLDGVAYLEAERAEWEHLQTDLHAIADERAAAGAGALAEDAA